MTCASLPPASLFHGFVATANLIDRVRSLTPVATLRDMIVAALLVMFAAAIGHADEHLQDWIPGVLTMPDDAEVMNERSIGSSIRMLSITTNADIDDLFADWEESLETNGYLIQQGEGELLDQSIEFSGQGISNAKIIVSPTEQKGRSLIEFDATLN